MDGFIDLSKEVSRSSGSIDAIIEKKAWLASNLDEADWVVTLSEAAIEEVGQMIATFSKQPLPTLLRRPDQFHIPNLRDVYTKVKKICDEGIGFAVIDRLPIDDFKIDPIVEVYWTLGYLMGPNVAQKWDGTMIYDVTDTGKQYAYGVRGSATDVELFFHTDNAFGIKVPDHVGLLCECPAKYGGVSRFCSLYSVHRIMEKKFPKQLERLYEPMHFDRQAEHASGAPKTSFAPFFSWHDNKLRCRANSSLVRKGYEVSKKKMDAELIEAIEAVDEVTATEDLWVEAPLAQGQVQYLNNHELGHYRSSFIDHDDPDKKRRLYRLWHRTDGSITYDGS